MTTTLGFAMFSFEGDKMVEAIANYFRNRKNNGVVSSVDEVVTALKNLTRVDSKKFGEATDTAVREAVLDYIDDGVKTVTFADGKVINFPPTNTPDDYDYLKS